MTDFEIGSTVLVTGSTMTGNVGTVVSFDAARNRHLVRIGAVTQNFFPPEDLRIFDARRARP